MIRIYAVSSLLFLLSVGCYSPVYVPRPAQINLLRDARDAEVSARLSERGVEADGAYAFSNHFYGRASGFWSQGGDDYEDRKYGQVTMGLGYFDFRPKREAPAPEQEESAISTVSSNVDSLRQSKNEDGRQGVHYGVNFDFSGAWVDTVTQNRKGQDEVSFAPYYPDYPHDHLSRHGQIWGVRLQPQIAYEWKHVAVGAALQGAADFFVGHDEVSDSRHEHWLLLQPAAFARFGFSKIKLEYQVGAAIPVYSRDSGEADHTAGLYSSLGVVFSF